MDSPLFVVLYSLFLVILVVHSLIERLDHQS